MKPRSNKTFDKYKSVIKSGRFTELEIIHFRKCLNSCVYSNQEQEGAELLDLFNESGPYKITKDQSLKGIGWLKRYCFRTNGEVRRSCKLDLDCVAIIRKFSRFEFVGLYSMQEHYGSFSEYKKWAPVYRTYSKDGSYFDYVPVHWDAPVVLDIVLKLQKVG
jgi:hypothetical protein